MGFIPEITCRHCGKSFSAIHNRCPHCGTRRVKQTTRTPSTTSSARQGTAANARAQASARFQLIFGCVLLLAVISSVIILIAAGVKGGGGGGDRIKKGNSNEDQQVATPTDLAEPTPSPTPTPTPEPEITSIGIYFLGEQNEGFVMKIGESVPLDAKTFPTDVVAEVTWTSRDPSVCTVDSTGLVTGVGNGNTYVVASCGSYSAECWVIVNN